jgi:hypothetical protein
VTDKEERRVKTCRVSETKVCVVCVPRRWLIICNVLFIEHF